MDKHIVAIACLPLLLGWPGPGHPEPKGAWPLQPNHQVVRRFEPPATAWGRGHRGVDLLGRPGQSVHAARGGVVVFVGRIAGRGTVVVRHGALRTTYEPVAAGVRVGQRVSQGQPIGTLTRERSHCAPRACLHWGLLRGHTYLNPLTLVMRRVRLLPSAARSPH